MDTHERRIIGALLLLLGFSFLAISIYNGQLETLMKMLSTILQA